MIEVEDEQWLDRAACVGVDPDLFFPAKGDKLSVRDAKIVCATCSVRAECLDYALRIKVRHGIWGGTTHKERRGLRRSA